MKTITLTLPEAAIRTLFKYLDRVPLEGREAPELVALMQLFQPKLQEKASPAVMTKEKKDE